MIQQIHYYAVMDKSKTYIIIEDTLGYSLKKIKDLTDKNKIAMKLKKEDAKWIFHRYVWNQDEVGKHNNAKVYEECIPNILEHQPATLEKYYKQWEFLEVVPVVMEIS